MFNMWKIVLRLKNGCVPVYETVYKDSKCFSSVSISYKTKHANLVKVSCCIKNNCHTSAVENPDVFGTLGNRKIKKIEMDEKEVKEQTDYIHKPRKMRRQYTMYKCAQEVSNEVKSNNLTAAINTLKRYGVQTNTYVYNIVLRELSRRGCIDDCYKLYKNMKEIGLKPNQATYTTLINVCAESKDPKALERLEWLRQSLHEKQVLLNDTHYNTMIKAYGRHGKTQEAFKLVDEMCDNCLPVGDYTYSALLQAAISNKEFGLRLALSAWHLMRYSRVDPKKHHYDLLLTAMKQTNIGGLKQDDAFLPEKDYAKIEYSESEQPNLLQSPPVMSGLLLPLVKGPGKGAQDIHTEIAKVNTSVSDCIKVLYENVDSILKINNLVLFGGCEGILKSMELDNVVPDITTMTIILELLPPSTQAEENLVSYIRAKDIAADTCFFNILMRRRIARKSFQEARDVLNMLQRANLTPDLATYQILALSCYRTREASEFLDTLSSMGYAPNKSIIAVLFKNACYNADFRYLTFLLSYMKDNELFPNETIIIALKDFVKELAQAKQKRSNKIRHRQIDHKNIPWMTEKISEFLVKMISKQENRDKKEKLKAHEEY